jgi:hypothetical protein
MLKNINYDQLIEAAVTYWANMFKNPEYGDKANGDQLDELGSIFMTYAKLTTNKIHSASDEKIAIFKKVFTQYLKDQAKMNHDCTISTDWAPEYPLSDFLQAADLANTYFPSKTMMWVHFSKGTISIEGKDIYPLVKK